MRLNTLVAFAISCLLLNSAAAQTVSYEDVLANPDDIKLSYLYAQQQVIKGDLEQASAALERVLLLQPNWDNARLFYAAVLFRLADMEGAVRELRLLADRPLSPAQHGEVKRYLALATAKSKTTRVSGRIVTGIRVDSNPDLTTSSSNDLNGNPLDTDARVDGAFIAASRIRIEHTLPGGSGSFAFFEANGNINEQFKVNEADYLTGGVKAGVSLYHNDFKFTPYATAAGLTLQQQLYRSEYGGGLLGEYTVNPRLTLVVGAQGIYQDYRVVSSDSVGSAHDGWLGSANGGFTVRTSEVNRISGRISGYKKNADNDSYSYDALELALSDMLLLGRGQYIVGRLSYRWQNYDQPDPNYSATVTRKDRLLKTRIAYGVPVNNILELINVPQGDISEGMNLQFGVSYIDQDSNIPNFDADSLSVDVMFAKRFTY